MKSIVKSLRLKEDQWLLIEKAMKEEQLKFSEYVLFALLKQKKSKKKNPLNQALVIEFARIGNNLNQIARHLNTNKQGIDRVGLEMLKRIEEHLQALRTKNDC